MEKDIIKFLSKYATITDELEKAIIESAKITFYPKGTLLLKEGDLANECYFLIKGCVRSYYIKEGEERTTAFFTEEQPISPLNFGTNTPSEYYLECIEDCYASIGGTKDESGITDRFPEVGTICLTISEAILTKQQKTFDFYMLSSPEERYLSIVKNRPDLVQRVPQYQLASFLGIKPESLSRIRKRLAQKKEAKIIS